jgi:hypothetical protein
VAKTTDKKYQPMDEDHRFPRWKVCRFASGLDVYYVPDLATAKIVLSTLRTLNPRGAFACEYPDKNGKPVLLKN